MSKPERFKKYYSEVKLPTFSILMFSCRSSKFNFSFKGFSPILSVCMYVYMYIIIFFKLRKKKNS